MIAFARAHKVALWIEFLVVALFVVAMAADESWGWMAFFGSLPWSIAATAVPGRVGLVIVGAGLGLNVVIATIVICHSVTWWLKTLRYGNDR